MKIGKADFDTLCEICQVLNDMEETDLFERLNNVILNIIG